MSTNPTISTVKSKGAIIEVASTGAAVAGVQRALVLAACGGSVSLLDKVSNPVLEMQLRGYGTSKFEAATEKGKSALVDYLGDIDAVVSSTKTAHPVLLGYSHAGFFTTQYAIAHSKKIGGLILVEPAVFNSADELHTRARLAEEGKNEDTLHAMLKVVQPEIANNHEASQHAVKAILQNTNSQHTLANELRVRADNPISEGALSKLSMPVLLIGGTKSHVSSIVTRFHRLLPTAYVWWIQGAAHTDLMSAKFSAQLQAVINAFTAGLG